MTGNKNQHITSNLQKLGETFKPQNVNFDKSECVFDLVIKKVLNPKLADEFLAHETTGKELFENFIKERLEGKNRYGDLLPKSKLPRLEVMLKSSLLN